MNIRFMTEADVPKAALVHQLAFVRQQNSLEWLQCSLNAFPRFFSFVAELNNEVVGYILWAQKSGFRHEVILELEQLAVLPESQGNGIGRKLIDESLPLVKEQLVLKSATLKHIVVTTRADNVAQRLYKSTLGAKVETTISNLYSADEVIMIARNVNF
ncbi:MAG: GNAT family N-acetyltransferase [Arenicella sp.]